MVRLMSTCAMGMMVSNLVLALGCASVPPPRAVYRDSITSIAVQVDPRAGQGHSHPAYVPAEQIRLILEGVRTQARKGFVNSITTGSAELVPAFNKTEAYALAPLLSKALAEATPQELVTFYRRYSDAGIGLGITSGGLFMEGNRMYFVLANNRTLPSEGMNQNMVHEVDPIDTPLLPISRTSFRVGFSPNAALIPADKRRPWHYIDEGRLIALDLGQIGEPGPMAPTAPIADPASSR